MAVSSYLCERAERSFVLLCPFADHFLVGYDDSNDVDFGRVPVDKDLSDEESSGVDSFDSLGCDILALREFENVLLPVNDLHAVPGQ